MAKDSKGDAESSPKPAKKSRKKASPNASAKPQPSASEKSTPAKKTPAKASAPTSRKSAKKKAIKPASKTPAKSGASKASPKASAKAAPKAQAKSNTKMVHRSSTKSAGKSSAGGDHSQGSDGESDEESRRVDLADLIQADCFITLKAGNKSEAIAELCEHAAGIAGLRSSQEILMQVLESESRLTTKMGPNWATPHARIPHLPKPLVVVVGKSEAGIPYDGTDDEPVNLIVLLLADEETSTLYLRALAAIVENLRKAKRVEAILKAKTGRGMRSALAGVPSGKRMVLSRQLPKATRMLIRNVLGFARDGEVGAVLLGIDAFERPEVLKSVVDDRTLLLTERHTVPQEIASRARGILRLPFPVEGESMALRLAIVLALGRKLIGRKEKVLAMIGPPGSNRIDLMRLYDARDFPVFDLQQPGESSLSPGVLERVIELAARIAEEGREGYPVGTIFIVGDPSDCKPYVRQLVINPFRGYESEELNVMDLTLEETIKEFSSIDGAFIIDAKGRLVSAGTYLMPEHKGELELTSGLGTRHRSAAMMSVSARCIAVVVSASTGGVTVYYRGEQVMYLSVARSRRVNSDGGNAAS